MNAVTNAVGLFLSGSPVEGVVAGAASPYINMQIKVATKDNPTANTVAHAVWGAVEAQLQGGNAAAGATAAASAELGAQYLAEKLYGTNNPENLTEAQKQTVSELSQTVAGLTASASGGNSANIAKEVSAGSVIGKNAVENNYLGDGFYEQCLVREQINCLTGRPFTGSNQNLEAQYKTLINSGKTFVDKFHLRIGVVLSPEFVAQLASDIV